MGEIYHPSLQDSLLVSLIFYFPVIVSFVFGTIIGSLSNVIIYRLVYYKSIWSPSSHCTSCGTEIPWYLNIPIVSYLVLRGRCRFCGAKFTMRYFWVELASGLLYALVILWAYTFPERQGGFGIPFREVFTYGFTATPSLTFEPGPLAMLWMAKAFIFTTLLIILTVIDLEHRLLPDRLTFPGTILGLLLSVGAPLLRPEIGVLGTSGVLDAFLQSLFGMLIGGGVLLLIAYLALMLAPVPMGAGDIKLVAMIGAFVGLFAIGPSLFLGFVIGGVISIVLLILGRAKMKSLIPFGPFLALGGLLGFYWGYAIWFWYLSYMKS